MCFLVELTCGDGATRIDADAHCAFCDPAGDGLADAAAAAALSSLAGGSACTCADICEYISDTKQGLMCRN